MVIIGVNGGMSQMFWRRNDNIIVSFFDFGFGPHPKNTHGGGAESAGGGKTGVG